MRKILRTAGLWLMIVAGLPLQSRAAQMLVPVGKVIGLQLQNDVLTVAAYDDIFGETARSAGLKIGDIVTKAGKKDITCGNDLVAVVAASEPGEKIVLTVYRSGKTLEITVEIGEQIQNSTQQQEQQQQPPSYRPW